MTRPRFGPPCLCALVLGLVAISASAAQASKWLILNSKKEVKTGSELSVPVAGEFERVLKVIEGKLVEVIVPGVLLTTILGIKTEISCTGFKLIFVKLEGEGKVSAGSKATFSGCGVKLNGVTNPECEAHSEGQGVGTIETNTFTGQLELIGFSGLTKVKPEIGSTFVTVLMGAGCPIGSKVPINGVVTIEDCEALLETHLVKHLVKENTINTALTALGNKATLDGSAWVFLSGASHTGLSWSGDKE